MSCDLSKQDIYIYIYIHTQRGGTVSVEKHTTLEGLELPRFQVTVSTDFGRAVRYVNVSYAVSH
jgi:hypothetical protein